LLAGIALVGSLAAFARRRLRPREPLPGVYWGLGRRQLLLFGLAGITVLGAITVARFGASRHEQTVASTQFWLLPATDSSAARLGVHNTEMAPMSLRLELTLNGSRLQEWPLIELAPGEQWEQEIPLTTANPGDTVEALLYRTSEPGSVFRRAIWRPVDQP
jgi:hypothetical protein